MRATPIRRATSWLLAMALLLQGLVALAHHPAFRAAPIPGLDGLIAICTPEGWRVVDRDDGKQPGRISPVAELCALCQSMQPAATEPPMLVAVAVPVAFVTVSVPLPPVRTQPSTAPPPSPRHTRAPPAV